MSVYLLIFIILLIIAFYKRRYNPKLYWFSIICLIIFESLRSYSIGTDTLTYKEIFDYRLSYIEPFWYGLNLIVHSLGLNFTGVLFGASCLTLIPLGLAFIRSSVNPQISLFFFYGLFGYLNSFNMMRQYVALSFVILAFTFYPNKSKSIILILIAAGFHFTALIGLSILLMKYIRLTYGRVIIGVVFSFIAGCIINDGVFRVLMGRYSLYLDGHDGFRDNMVYAAVMAMLMNVLFLFTFYITKAKDRNILWMKLFFIGVIVTNISMQLVLGARIILYFTMSQLILFPYIINYCRERHPFIIKTLLICYTFLIFMKLLIANNNYLIPYKIALS